MIYVYSAPLFIGSGGFPPEHSLLALNTPAIATE